MPQLEIYTLGGSRFVLEGEDFQGFSTRKVEALALYLVFTKRPQPREVLADLLWDDRSQSRATSNLRVALTNLRKHLAPFFTISRDSAALNQEADVWLDVAELELLPAAGRGNDAGDGPTGVDSIKQIETLLALYKGEFLQGFSVRGARQFEEWVTVERERLHRLTEEGLSQVVTWHLAHGDYPAGIQQAARWLGLDPLNEAAHRAMMRLLVYNGQAGAALHQYQQCVRVLDEELGLTPSQDTTELYEAIHSQQLRPPRERQVAVPAEEELPPEPGEPPFKGLAYYDVPDAHLFFGREELAARLVKRIDKSRFLAVVGASGSGKSSLVRAGLLPALTSDQAPTAGSSPPLGSELWPIHLITPTTRPLKALALSLTREAESTRATAALIDDLAQEPRSLDIYVEKLLVDNPAQRLLLVIDQFEELFTQCRDEVERRAFVDNLLAAVTGNPSGAAAVVITLRADFYAHCARYNGLRELLESHQIYIGQMTDAELRLAIQGPAEASGWMFEPGLVDLLLHDVGAGRNRVPEPGALPLLSHALLETWRRRRGRQMTFSGYAETGGVRRAIARTAEAVFNDDLTAEQRPIARSIFLRLTELGEGAQDTRRRATLGELTPRAEEAPAVEEVLKILADARLVTTGQQGVEVAHEALIREWPRLGEWLAEDREGLRLHRQLAEAARDWDALGRDEGALYRGARLAQAGEWAERHDEELNALEREFLEASQELARREEAEREAQRQRELEAARELARSEQRRAEEQEQAADQLRRRRRYLLGALALAVLLALAAAFFGYQATNERNAALLRAQIARAALALQAQDDLVDFPQRALLMAVEAAPTTVIAGEPPTVAAEQALRDSLAQVGGQVLPSLDGPVSEAAFSPDGRWLAWTVEASEDILWLWDLRTDDPQGYRFESLVQATTGSSKLRFTGDGRWLAWAHEGVTQLWDLGGANPAEDFVVLGDLQPLFSPSIDYDPERQWLAASTTTFTYGDNYVLKLWDLSSNDPASTLLQSPPQPGSHNEIFFSPDGHWLVTTGLGLTANVIEDGDLPRLWDLTTEDPAANPVILGGIEAEIVSTTMSGDGRWLAAGDDGNSVYLWDLASPNPAVDLVTLHLEETPAEESQATRVWWQSFSRDNRKLFAVLGNTVWYWDMTAGGPAGQSEVFRAADEIVDATLSPDDRWLVTVDDGGEALLWDLSAAEPTDGPVKLRSDDLPVVHAHFSGDGRWLAVQVTGNVAQLWDFSDPEGIVGPITLGGHEAMVTEATLSPDGRRLVTGDADRMVRLWDLENLQSGTDPLSMTAHEDEVWALAASADNRWLASGSADGEIRLWGMDGGAPPGGSLQLPGHEAGIIGLVFTSDGRRLVSGSEDGTILMWNLENGHPVVESIVLDGLETGMNVLALGPDDEQLVTGDGDGEVRLWNLSAPDDPMAFHGHEGGVEAVAIGSDGRWLATGGADNAARLWDLTAADPTPTAIVLPGHIQEVTALAFTPDGRWLATGSVDRTARLWDLTADDPAADPVILEGHSDLINVLAISPDGTRLATAGDTFLENTARLWDLTADYPAPEESSFPPIPLPDQEAEAKAIAITPDSRWLVLGGEDGRLTFWRLKIDDLVASACIAAGRNLSLAEWRQFFPGDAYRQTCPQWPAAEETALQEAEITMDE